MTSRPVWTSTADGHRDAKEIAGLRPMAEPKPRAPRKASNPALRQVTNGIVCFCGERFGEHQALEFMLHLRAEVGDDLGFRSRVRRYSRDYRRERYASDPEFHDRTLAQSRENQRRRMADPEVRAAKNERARARFRERYANDPEFRERKRVQSRDGKREQRARKKADRGTVST